jgi:hypothetical protein
VRADRVLPGRRRLQLRLLGERQLRDVLELDGAVELRAVERRALEDVGDLLAERLGVGRQLLLPGAGLDLRIEDHGS